MLKIIGVALIATAIFVLRIERLRDQTRMRFHTAWFVRSLMF